MARATQIGLKGTNLRLGVRPQPKPTQTGIPRVKEGRYAKKRPKNKKK